MAIAVLGGGHAGRHGSTGSVDKGARHTAASYDPDRRVGENYEATLHFACTYARVSFRAAGVFGSKCSHAVVHFYRLSLSTFPVNILGFMLDTVNLD